MSQENVGVVRRMVERWNTGDVEGWLRCWHTDAEWISEPPFRALEGRPRTYRGHAELRRFPVDVLVRLCARTLLSLSCDDPSGGLRGARSLVAGGPYFLPVSSAHRESTSRLIASARRAAARHARHTGQGPHPRFSAGMRLCEASKTARLPPVTQGFGDRIARRAYVSTTCAASAGTSTRGARGTTVLARDRHGHDRDLRAAGQHCLRGVDWSAVGVGPGQILFACL
jgi:hypothetical protein